MKDLNMMVCPHDTARNPEGWHRIVKYLAARLDTQIHLIRSLDFAEFRQGMASSDLVYSNSTDSLSLFDSGGFRPLVHPANSYDEALLIAGPEGDLPAIEAIHGATVATVTQLPPTRLALKMLRERGIFPSGLTHRDSWLSVVRSVWNGEVPFGILYRDAYDALSLSGREMIRVLETTNDRSDFHMLCAGPAICDAMVQLTDVLTAMCADQEGKAMLAGLHISKWIPVTDDDLTRLRALMAL
jgi:hypothetical protein